MIFIDSPIIEQVDSNKLSLLLKNILQNTQLLQLFTEIIKTEIIYKSNKDATIEGTNETEWSN
jgi:hypothetical protein